MHMRLDRSSGSSNENIVRMRLTGDLWMLKSDSEEQELEFRLRGVVGGVMVKADDVTGDIPEQTRITLDVCVGGGGGGGR